MKNWSSEQQCKRRNEVFELYRKQMGDCIDDAGSYHGKETEINFRERIWHCLQLLEGSKKQVYTANRILEKLQMEKCHFAPMNCMQILLHYEDILEQSIITKLEDYVRSSLILQSGSKVRFPMYNDNFAAMATFTLLTAGERFADKAMFEEGVKRLNQLRELYTRCGAVMEYCSPTYTPLTILCMAEICNYVKDPEIRALALKCEERGWAEAASHYHAPSGHLAGPYSRAYTVDSVGHPHLLNFVLYLVFGDDIFINPIRDMFPPRTGQIIHCGLERLMLPNMVWQYSTTYHCPDYLAELLLSKTYPFTAISRTECLPSRITGYKTDVNTGEKIFVDNAIEFPATSGPIYTYMTKDFSLGTAHSQFHDGGLSESFYITYRKKVPASDLADTGIVLSRYLINEREPETLIPYNVYGTAHGSIGFRDEGRKFGMQHEACSLVVYKPKHFEADSISSLKVSLIFPCHFAGVEEIRIGDQKAESCDFMSSQPETVFVKDGPVYMAFTPLALTDHGRKAAVRVQYVNNYIMISFYNYEGPARSFDMKELFLTSSGFAAHVKTTGDFPDIEAFIQYVNSFTLSDTTTLSEDAYTRWISYGAKNGPDLRFAYSPISEGIMIAAINGRPRPDPVFQATGLNADRLPFISDKA